MLQSQGKSQSGRGVSMTGWTPQGSGANFQLSTVLQPMAAYKDDMLVLTGLGISSLSMAPGALAEVGRSIAAVSLGVCQRAGRAACDAESPTGARDAVRNIVTSTS